MDCPLFHPEQWTVPFFHGLSPFSPRNNGLSPFSLFLAGTPVQIRFSIRNAKLYSFQFRPYARPCPEGTRERPVEDRFRPREGGHKGRFLSEPERVEIGVLQDEAQPDRLSGDSTEGFPTNLAAVNPSRLPLQLVSPDRDRFGQ